MNTIFNILSCEFNNKLELPLYILYDDNLNYNLKFYNQKQFNLNFLYKYIIVFILSWKFIYNFFSNINNLNLNIILVQLFDIFIIIQFFLLKKYCLSNHFNNNLKNNKFFNNLKIFSYFSFLYSIFISILLLILFNIGYFIAIYSKISTDNIIKQFFLSLLLFLETFYTNLTLLLFFSIFITNMYIHYYQINNLYNYIKDNIKDYTNNNVKISSIAKDFSKIKDSYEKTIYETFYYFSLFNLFGFINLYITIYFLQSNIYLFYNIYFSIIFLIIDIFFIFILQSIKYIKIKINNQISSESFINIFFNSSLNYNNNFNDNIDYKILDIININKNNIINLENNIDWINLQQIISAEWKKYYIFGIPIDDLSILNKLFAIFIIFSIGKNLFIIINA